MRLIRFLVFYISGRWFPLLVVSFWDVSLPAARFLLSFSLLLYAPTLEDVGWNHDTGRRSLFEHLQDAP